MLTLFDNPFSPFARKVRMVLHVKGLEFESVDALATIEHDRLVDVHPRAEVPVLVDRGFTVTDSTDIVYYLEDCYPTPAVFPLEPPLRAKARRWQPIADTRAVRSSRALSLDDGVCAGTHRGGICNSIR